MAHFAKLDENNKVLEVLVVHNNELMVDGEELEAAGIYFLAELTGHAKWMQTSYNGNFRKNYAAVGGYYDPALDAFIWPQPYPSWVLNPETCHWEAPTPFPVSMTPHEWDEQICDWVAVEPA